MFNAITDVPGIRVGHASNLEAKTGCTVILCEEGAVAGVDVRGTAAGTRQLDSLSPLHLVNEVHAVCLAGGSAFGLDAAGGVAKFLEEQGKGLGLSTVRVPIVPTAIIFDLFFGNSEVRPDREMGYQACLNCTSEKVKEGSVGVGTGATVGKLYTVNQAMKGGVGTASARLPGGVIVGAFAVVNAFGDVVDISKGEITAGTRVAPDSLELANSGEKIKEGVQRDVFPGESTTLGVIATNCRLSKEQATKVAQMAQDGIARVIDPAHSLFDGDVTFTLSLGNETAEVNTIGRWGVELIGISIQRAVREADGYGIIPACQDLKGR